MHRGAVVVAFVLVLAPTAAADEQVGLYERLWPQAPVGGGLTLSQQIGDSLTALGDIMGYHFDQLSNGEVGFRFDGRKRRARLRFGSSDSERFLVFRLASDVHFTRGVARVQAKLELGIAGHTIDLELPEFDVAPTSVYGERGVEVRIPLFKRAF